MDGLVVLQANLPGLNLSLERMHQICMLCQRDEQMNLYFNNNKHTKTSDYIIAEMCTSVRKWEEEVYCF